MNESGVASRSFSSESDDSVKDSMVEDTAVIIFNPSLCSTMVGTM